MEDRRRERRLRARLERRRQVARPAGSARGDHRHADRGAGELLVTSIDTDGTLGGYDIELLRRICGAVGVPVIASGGAGGPRDLASALEAGAQAALAASIFHDGVHTIAEVKQEVARCGLPMRM